MPRPLRIINSCAPVRICDIGGWTDTWFAKYGSVLNLSVYPFVHVQLFVYPPEAGKPDITVFAENYNERFQLEAGKVPLAGEHALLKAAISYMGLPADMAVELHIYSEMPPGASTGTSASVSIALIGALDLLRPERMTPYEIACAAHGVETKMLGLQCGVQDQLASAYGGINLIEITDYPRAAVSPVRVSDGVWWELERRLMLVYLGSAHVSSDVHRQVIANFEQSGADDPRLAGLRRAAHRAKNALLRGDFGAFAEAMKVNTELQKQMHEDIFGDKARTVVETAVRCGALGYKLNGAGGNGGSITLLFGESSHEKRLFQDALSAVLPDARIIPVALSRFGLQTWEVASEQAR